MEFYVKKLQLTEGESVKVVMHKDDVLDLGADIRGKVILTYKNNHLVADLMSTDEDAFVPVGYVGLSTDHIKRFSISEGESVTIDILQRPESLDNLVKKIKGEELSANEIDSIVSDIVNGLYRQEEITYFASSMLNPGFTEVELRCLIKSMVSTGDTYDFSKIGKLVIDKHSTGGVAGKGITPIVVSLLANYDVVVPNTSTKTITTANATSNMLESIMNIELSEKEMFDTVEKCNAMMVWGGYLKLAPLDDILINVEKLLHYQSKFKVIASIIAKKICLGVQYLYLDVVYGPNLKMDSLQQAEWFAYKFTQIAGDLGLSVIAKPRYAGWVDGSSVGVRREMSETLKVLERREDRNIRLEGTSVKMATELLKFVFGEGKNYEAELIELLDSKKALDKFISIVNTQGSKVKDIVSTDLVGAVESKSLLADKDIVVKALNHKKVALIAKRLGAPIDIDAGIQFDIEPHQKVKAGERILTIYSRDLDKILSIKDSELLDMLILS